MSFATHRFSDSLTLVNYTSPPSPCIQAPRLGPDGLLDSALSPKMVAAALLYY